MAITCGAKCAKGVLVTFNLVFWISGLALLGLGIFLLLENDRVSLYKLFRGAEESHALIQYLAYGCIGVGGLVFIIGFFGCCGAIRESKCMLVTYVVFLFLILAAELAVGILAVIFQDKMFAKVENNLTETLKRKYGTDPELTKAVDLMQAKFECCGVRGADDYQESAWKESLSRTNNVPLTCCLLNNKQEPRYFMEPKPQNNTLCQKENPTENEHFRHQSSCLLKLDSFIKMESLLLIAAGCGLSALQIFGVVFAICLCKSIQ